MLRQPISSWFAYHFVSAIVLLAALPVAIGQRDNPDAEAAAAAARALSRLEAEGDFDALYDRMHPDAQAIIPREAVVGWYGEYLADKETAELTVTDIQFVDWTWPVTGVTYPDTAEISFVQPFQENGSWTDVSDVIRLVEYDGEWRWFFGRSSEFVEEQIAKYASSSPSGSSGAEDTFPLGIVATNCGRRPTGYPFLGGDCVPADGAVITLTTPNGELVDTCIAEAPAPDSRVAVCSIPMPYGSSVVVTEDVSTIDAGYAPTFNPQPFHMPTEPPDGVFGGPVFLNLPVGSVELESPEPQAAAPEVAFADEPWWWIVPFAPGHGNTEDGDLYFGALVENPTEETISVGVSFQAYKSDGTPFTGCYMPGGDGPGVDTAIAPGEVALLRCKRTIVPITLDGLQVTADLWDVQPVQGVAPAIEVIGAEFVAKPKQSSPMETIYQASALVRATSGSDTDVTLLFRFYDEQGIQVGTCQSYSAKVEPEIDQRVTCSVPLTIDTASPQPVTVRAEPSPV
jgi:hypothetical protein